MPKVDPNLAIVGAATAFWLVGPDNTVDARDRESHRRPAADLRRRRQRSGRREQYLERIAPHSSAYLTSGAVTAFSSQVKYTQGLTQDYLQQVTLVIPLKGMGKIRILSVDGDLVGAGGY